MRIRNNTNNKVVIYAGDPNAEEPEFVKTLQIGEEVEINNKLAWYISLQDK